MAVDALQCTLNPSLITVDICYSCCSILFPFSLFVHNNDDFLGHHLAESITFMPVIIYKRNDLS